MLLADYFGVLTKSLGIWPDDFTHVVGRECVGSLQGFNGWDTYGVNVFCGHVNALYENAIKGCSFICVARLYICPGAGPITDPSEFRSGYLGKTR